MKRRKYLISLGIGTGIGLAATKYSTNPTIASNINLENEKDIEATTRIIDSEDAELNLKFTEFIIKPQNFISEIPKFNIIGKTTVQNNTIEKHIIEDEEIEDEKDITSLLSNDTATLPLEIEEEGENIPVEIEFIIEPTNYDVDSTIINKQIQLTVTNDFEIELIFDDVIETNTFAEFRIDPVDAEFEEEDLDITWTFDGEEPEDETFQGSLSISQQFSEAKNVELKAEVIDKDTDSKATAEETLSIVEFEGEISEPHEEAPEDISEIHDDLEGDGSESDPYLITDDHELQAINHDTGSYYKLDKNIDATLTDQWNDGDGFTPINEFTGHFDGDGKFISGLTIDRPSTDYVALFGGRSSYTIKDLTLNEPDITGYERVGTIAAQPDNGMIERVGIVQPTVKGKGEYTAGLAPQPLNGTEIHESYVIGGSVIGEANYVGGFVARSSHSSSIFNSYSRVFVSGEGSRVAAFLGYGSSNPSEFENIYAAGPVAGDGKGLIGDDSSGDDFENAYWDKEETEQDTSAAGIGLTEEEMIGENAEENMNFDWGDTWITTDVYPQLKNNLE